MLLTALDPATFTDLTLLVDDASDAVRPLATEDLTDRSVLLDPLFLYNTDDLRFHTLDDLRPSTLPESLADAASVSALEAAYHLIRLQ